MSREIKELGKVKDPEERPRPLDVSKKSSDVKKNSSRAKVEELPEEMKKTLGDFARNHLGYKEDEVEKFKFFVRKNEKDKGRIFFNDGKKDHDLKEIIEKKRETDPRIHEKLKHALLQDVAGDTLSKYYEINKEDLKDMHAFRVNDEEMTCYDKNGQMYGFGRLKYDDAGRKVFDQAAEEINKRMSSLGYPITDRFVPLSVENGVQTYAHDKLAKTDEERKFINNSVVSGYKFDSLTKTFTFEMKSKGPEVETRTYDISKKDMPKEVINGLRLHEEKVALAKFFKEDGLRASDIQDLSKTMEEDGWKYEFFKFEGTNIKHCVKEVSFGAKRQEIEAHLDGMGLNDTEYKISDHLSEAILRGEKSKGKLEDFLKAKKAEGVIVDDDIEDVTITPYFDKGEKGERNFYIETEGAVFKFSFNEEEFKKLKEDVEQGIAKSKAKEQLGVAEIDECEKVEKKEGDKYDKYLIKAADGKECFIEKDESFNKEVEKALEPEQFIDIMPEKQDNVKTLVDLTTDNKRDELEKALKRFKKFKYLETVLNIEENVNMQAGQTGKDIAAALENLLGMSAGGGGAQQPAQPVGPALAGKYVDNKIKAKEKKIKLLEKQHKNRMITPEARDAKLKVHAKEGDIQGMLSGLEHQNKKKQDDDTESITSSNPDYSGFSPLPREIEAY